MYFIFTESTHPPPQRKCILPQHPHILLTKGSTFYERIHIISLLKQYILPQILNIFLTIWSIFYHSIPTFLSLKAIYITTLPTHFPYPWQYTSLTLPLIFHTKGSIYYYKIHTFSSPKAIYYHSIHTSSSPKSV